MCATNRKETAVNFFLFYVASNVYLLCFLFFWKKRRKKNCFLLQLRLCAVVVVLSFFRSLCLSFFLRHFFFKDICFSVECSIYITITKMQQLYIYILIVYINEIFEDGVEVVMSWESPNQRQYSQSINI